MTTMTDWVLSSEFRRLLNIAAASSYKGTYPTTVGVMKKLTTILHVVQVRPLANNIREF